ncbi:MAG TPA: conjugal transfer protein TrbL family protein [Candidatus Limnocylindrales bacterium]|nr:conjugal transfer protein TrbL family protein [Candidatus Limnocylindrales bacterium]
MSWVADSLIGSILSWFAKLIVGGLNVLWDLLSASVFVSPDVTVLPQVRTFSATSLGVVNTAYVLAILWMAILVMGRDTIQSRYGPGELIPRLVIGLIAANLSMPLCSTLIQLANALTGALTQQDITAPTSMLHMRSVVASALNDQNGSTPAGFLMLLIGLVIAVLVAALLVQWVTRLGVLIIAVGVAPIALALHGTPQTEGAAKLWWRTIVGTLGTVVLQAVALHTALSIFLNPSANLPALGIPGAPGTTMNLFIVLCLLWGVVKIPALMRRYITRSTPSHVGTILRVVLIQQVTRGLSRSRGGRSGATAARPARSGGWPVRP